MANDNTDSDIDYAASIDASVTTAEGKTMTAEEAIAEAEVRLAEAIAMQQDWADEDMSILLDACSAAENEPENRTEHFELIFARSHDLKGMGTSFGYELVTEVSESLCNYLRDNPRGEFEIVALHVRSLKLILDETMQGDAGEDGQKLIEGLREIVKKRGSGDKSS